VQRTEFTFRSLQEAAPGPKWGEVFAGLWPGYRRWFLRQGDAARPTYAESARMLRRHMPEIVPIWTSLVEIAGGGDTAARMLALVDPPPYLTGCSQGVWHGATGAEDPLLVRNYDYDPARLEGIVWHTTWAGRRVMGMGDCLWGLLDGVNEDGLAVSLAFGGRPVIGRGFGVSLVVRYLLETCSTVAEARGVLARLPYQLAHTLTMADAGGAVATAHLSPDRGVRFSTAPAATNHQGPVEWTEHAAATRTLEREACILRTLADPSTTASSFIQSFLAPPLRNTAYSRGFGTLYTAAYRPAAGVAEYVWPGSVWRQSLDVFREETHGETLVEAHVA
jgi:predicted choloylglycine hydrolase